MRVSSQIQPLEIYSTQFKPLGTQFLGRYEELTETVGGIKLPRPENTWWADVVVPGPDCECQAGERVLMGQYRGENIEFLDGSFTILDEIHGLAVES